MTTALNKMPPRWYEAWLRPDSSSFTLGVCCIWIIVFIAEQYYAVWPGIGLQPDSHTNAALGALSVTAVDHGQIWRFFTNPFLHGGPNHLISDILALIGISATFQAIVGRAWFGASFALLALISETVSYSMLSNSAGTIGPAGTVMGLLATNLVLGFRFQDPEVRKRVWQASFGALFTMLVSTFRPQSFPVDIPNHVAGAICGVMLGLCLLAIWPKEQPKPRYERLALIFARAFGLIAAVGFVATTLLYHQYADEVRLRIPLAQLQFLPQKNLQEIAATVAEYPTDPVGHVVYGNFLLVNNRAKEAEKEAQIAIALSQKSLFGPEFAYDENLLLSIALWNHGQVERAKEIFSEFCSEGIPQTGIMNARAALATYPLCDR